VKTSAPYLLTLRRVSLVAVAVPACVACGGGGGDAAHKPASVGAAAPAGEKKAEETAPYDTERWIALGENPKWKPIQPLFQQYALREAPAMSDPMFGKLAEFVRKPAINQLAVAATGPGADGPEKVAVPTSPLTAEPLAQYQLIILMTGIPQPKAVVVDLSGTKFTVVRGDAIGSEGGRVHQILQYKMVVAVPGEPKPVEITIQPPLTEVEQAIGDEKAEL
jgi:hypothetical protein